MIKSLTTHFPAVVLPESRSGLIDWFDVVPPDPYGAGNWPRKLTINPVALLHASGVYRDPEWSTCGKHHMNTTSEEVRRAA